MQFKYIHILLLLCIYSCTIEKEEKQTNTSTTNFHYNLNQPFKTWKLQKELVEISGLSYINDTLLACNQDEKGNIYTFNINKGRVTRRTFFETYGDFEGIEIIGKDAWLVKSNGTLYQIPNYNTSKVVKAIHYKTTLSKHNNIEGLAFDKENNSLLIACKNYPFTKKNNTGNGKLFKGIYQFNLNNKKLSATPKILISLDDIGSFYPSGIAIHPLEKDIYILSSVGKRLLIISKEGNIKKIISLHKKIYQQPEGICFSPNGTMYISNEGKNGKATILQFLYQ